MSTDRVVGNHGPSGAEASVAAGPTDGSLTRYVEVVVSPAEDGMRALKFAKQHLRHVYSTGLVIKQAFKRDEVAVNGQVVLETKLLAAGDRVTVRADPLLGQRDRNAHHTWDVAYEDDHLAVVYKPPGADLTHLETQAPSVLSGCQIDSALSQYRVWHVNRVEKGSFGLALLAKAEATLTSLQAAYATGAVEETYVAVCHGNAGTAVRSLAAASEWSTPPSVLQTVRCNSSGHLTLARFAPRSPRGGACVRRQMLDAGHPVVGVGSRTRRLKSSGKGLYLALVSLAFDHPTTGVRVAVERPLPPKFEQLLRREAEAFQRKADAYFARLAEFAARQPEAGNALESDLATFDHTRDRPLAYVLGEQTFATYPFHVTPATLIPRPSSESLVRAALELVSGGLLTTQVRVGPPSPSRSDTLDIPGNDLGQGDTLPLHVLDVGTGSGCLLIATLLGLPADTLGVGLDISAEALAVATRNGTRHDLADRITWLQDDMTTMEATTAHLTTRHPFDLVLCNPPYLNRETGANRIFKANREHEPAEALFAGENGYEFYHLLQQSLTVPDRCLLRPGGYLVLEVGQGMAPRVKTIMANGLTYFGSLMDRFGMERCLIFQR
ncbi:hypothetical protein IWQ60_001350 [Tieghemiomyces parasiticus]|uniref:Methyltransferase domain-containing protein n=1 Tax=Tieghemiomyces parasiticus TaxID=78921 RepID=A0A9W8AE67_9FUNG|nr:hypothetical protein IWQ60_001350 [Tieghemiomyces parasiticus]